MRTNQQPDKILTEYPIGSYVLVSYDERPPSKLHSVLQGPFQVINIIGSKYALKNLVTDKNSDYHISRLRQFYLDNDQDPALIANKDQQMVIVQQILDIKGDPKNLANNYSF